MSAEAHAHHIIPKTTLYKVLGALLVLTFLTVAVAKPVSGLDLGVLNGAVAVLIASVKAALVVSIFMGLKYDDKLYLGLMLTGVFFLILLFAFSVLDIYTRVPEASTL